MYSYVLLLSATGLGMSDLGVVVGVLPASSLLLLLLLLLWVGASSDVSAMRGISDRRTTFPLPVCGARHRKQTTTSATSAVLYSVVIQLD